MIILILGVGEKRHTVGPRPVRFVHGLVHDNLVHHSLRGFFTAIAAVDAEAVCGVNGHGRSEGAAPGCLVNGLRQFKRFGGLDPVECGQMINGLLIAEHRFERPQLIKARHDHGPVQDAQRLRELPPTRVQIRLENTEEERIRETGIGPLQQSFALGQLGLRLLLPQKRLGIHRKRNPTQRGDGCVDATLLLTRPQHLQPRRPIDLEAGRPARRPHEAIGEQRQNKREGTETQ
mmetsp:Transcript_13529/g.25885  ORF Transcript_13529/g.25885 Transcript_13529/m.25885 type:complete len:233 (-) Transcript_13529:707-1405(-)